eukprot:12527-Chlamydomonas_euryale.AAC.1
MIPALCCIRARGAAAATAAAGASCRALPLLLPSPPPPWQWRQPLPSGRPISFEHAAAIAAAARQRAEHLPPLPLLARCSSSSTSGTSGGGSGGSDESSAVAGVGEAGPGSTAPQSPEPSARVDRPTPSAAVATAIDQPDPLLRVPPTDGMALMAPPSAPLSPSPPSHATLAAGQAAPPKDAASGVTRVVMQDVNGMLVTLNITPGTYMHAR